MSHPESPSLVRWRSLGSAWHTFGQRRPWLRRGLVAGLWVGGFLAIWLLVTAVHSWLYYQSIGREPYRTSHLRIAAKKLVSNLVEPIYDDALENLGALPAYELVLSEKRLAEWRQMLDRVYARGHALESDQVWFPARFWHRGEVREVDVRGRGTLFTHYKASKPSLRIKFPRDEFFRGQRVINLIIPYDQARVVGDPTINAVARNYGLITYPTRFVTLKVNGDQLGVYHEVPHFRKELAVLQFRSEGFFMSSLGDPKGISAEAFAGMVEDDSGFARALRAFSDCVGAPCDPAEARRVLDSYVDFDRMAAYAAITTLFGASHGWGEDNLILFFDPPRGRLEPVPWDMGTLRLGRGDDPFVGLESVKGIGASFLRFDDFRLARDRILWDVLERQEQFALEEADRLFAELEPALDADTEHSRRYTRRRVDYFRGALEHNFALWREHLQAPGLEAELDADGQLRLVNRAAAAVEVSVVELESAEGRVRFELEPSRMVPGRYRETVGTATLDLTSIAAPSIAAPSVDGAAGRESAFPFGEVGSVRLVGENAVTGTPLELETTRPPAPSSTAPPSTAPSSTADLGTSLGSRALGEERGPSPPAGVRVEGTAEAPVWVFSGSLRLRHSLAVPERVAVRLEPGTNLTLDPDVYLVVRGDLDSRGTAEAPIWIGASDVEHPFAFLTVLGRSDRPAVVRLEHTTVQGGREGSFDAATFTGMLSIYDGHLVMRQSRILDARGEDGLNVKFGYAELYDNEFARIASDAVDLDFCRGLVKNNTFREVKADGLDLSGSLVRAEGNLLEDLSDKGFSIGEATSVALVGNTIRRAVTGVAVKDVSRAWLDPGPMGDLRIGLALYQKKQVFGSGSLLFEGGLSGQTETACLVDPGAWLHRTSSSVGSGGAAP